MVVGRLIKVTRDGSIIFLHVRTHEGKRKVKVVDFRPYFYVPHSSGDYVSIDGSRVRIIYANKPEDVRGMRKFYHKHYEADIPYTRRFLIDTNLFSYVEIPDYDSVSFREIKPSQGNIDIRVWYLDIEMRAEHFPDPDKAEYPISSITIHDSYTQRFLTFLLTNKVGIDRRDRWDVVCFTSEEDMLQNFVKVYNRLQPDVVAGWNIIYFDLAYLQNRCRKLGVHVDFSSSQFFDMLEAFRKLYKRSSYRLKSVAVEEGFINKPSTIVSFTSISDEELIQYNKMDVELLLKINSKYRLLDFYWALKELAGVNGIDDTFTHSVLIDTLVLREAKRRKIVLPSKPEVEHAETYEGAIVLQPPKGIFKDIAVFDMSRYYPSIIISWNISPDTLWGDIKLGSISFKSYPYGIIPQVCLTLLDHRTKIEEELSKLTPGTPEYENLKSRRDAVKYLVNAVYGFMAYSGSRVYDVKLASSVTMLAREGITKAIDLFKSFGYDVVYGDTDSILARIPLDKAEEVCENVNTILQDYFKTKYSLRECLVRLKFSKYLSTVTFTGVKKRYACHVIWEDGKSCDYIDVVGFEAVRTDQSRYARNLQRKLFDMILRGCREDEIREFIKSSISEVKSKPFTEICFTKGIDKPLDKYKTRPQHIRATLYSNMYLKTNFKSGDRVYILFVKNICNHPKTDVIAFDESTNLPDVEVDWDKMIEVNVRRPLESILEAFGLRWDNIFTKKGVFEWL